MHLPNDQELPPAYISLVNNVLADHVTPESSAEGVGQLMFQPFVRWLEQNITDIFKEIAKEVCLGLQNRKSFECKDSRYALSILARDPCQYDQRFKCISIPARD